MGQNETPKNHSQPSGSAGFPGWAGTTLLLAGLLAGTIALLAVGAQRTASRPAGTATADERIGVVAAEAVHRALAIAASRLEPPALLPVASEAQVASHDAPKAVDPGPTLPPVPPESQVSLVLTSSAIGELDPCG